MVEASAAEVEGAEYAGITVLNSRSVDTPAASDELVCAIDRHQYTLREGPCLSAATERLPVVRVDDLAADDRWPRFSAAVTPLAVRSMLSFQLYTDTDTIGALNIYSAVPHAFTEESVHTGLLLATHAALAAAATIESANLRTALRSRDTIGQAKGILMERYKITSERAFDLLIAASQRTNRKLRDLAEQLCTTGVIPDGPGEATTRGLTRKPTRGPGTRP